MTTRIRTYDELHATIPGRVRDGVVWLDEHVEDWRSVIDPNRLDLTSACDCVLGQLAADIVPPSPVFGINADYTAWLYDTYQNGEVSEQLPASMTREDAVRFGFVSIVDAHAGEWVLSGDVLDTEGDVLDPEAVADREYGALTHAWLNELDPNRSPLT